MLRLVAALSVLASCFPQAAPAPTAVDPATAKRTDELIERVARLELGIRRHRELAAERERGLSAELEKILAGVVRLATPKKEPPLARRLLPDVVYSVPIEGSSFEGPTYAPVTLVFASDFTCTFCESLSETIAALRGEFGKDLKVVYQNASGESSAGRAAALVHCAADLQKRGAIMRGELWREQRVGSNSGDLEDRFVLEKLLALAVSLGSNRDRLLRDVRGACSTQIDIEAVRFKKLGVVVAPVVFVNGRVVAGPQRIETFRSVVSEELIRAKRAVAAGVKLRRYYDVLVATGARTATAVEF